MRRDKIIDVEVTNHRGEIAIVATIGGRIICPVCGIVWNEEHPTHPAGIEQSHYVCECNTHFGYDDMASNEEAEVHPLSLRWQYLRIEWLNKIRWSNDAIAQILAGLSITREELIEQQSQYADDRAWHLRNMERQIRLQRQIRDNFARASRRGSD